ncbi:metal-sulfur cluster assembly factor [Candidatus Roizmanbacteria bacterium]|nr:metal-sulfur cluster assembly factor [Candidatus Roizmanbacteria bacterium]
MITESEIRSALEEVMDPELHVSIVDLGLVYTIVTSKSEVRITMTLTTIGCPLFPLIEQEIRDKLISIGVPQNGIQLELTFDPPWSVDRMSEKAKAMLGI